MILFIMTMATVPGIHTGTGVFTWGLDTRTAVLVFIMVPRFIAGGTGHIIIHIILMVTMVRITGGIITDIMMVITAGITGGITMTIITAGIMTIIITDG